ncbi:MAG: hypothetical protein AB7U34_07045, partial [Novosphingobium sp.]
NFDPANAGDAHSLLIDQTNVRGKTARMVYAPFDDVNTKARIAIVGMTPGAFQAQKALNAAHDALRSGKSPEEAAHIAKVHASFSGEPMRANLIRMMDHVGIGRLLGLKSTKGLWGADSHLVHFTSALRYPVFVDGKNWSGNPDMVRTPALRTWLFAYTGAELATLHDAFIVPLGPKVAAAMLHLAEQGLIDKNRIMDGMPHPSGANQERVACFLGDKPASACSAKTNPQAIYAMRDALCRKVTRLAG